MAAERQFRRVVIVEAAVEDMEPQSSIIEHAKTLMDTFCPSGEWLESEFNDLVLQCLRHSDFEDIHLSKRVVKADSYDYEDTENGNINYEDEENDSSKYEDAEIGDLDDEDI